MLPGVLRRPCRAWRLAALGAAAVLAGLLAASLGGTAGAQEAGPTISSVSISSSPADTVSYLTGETIRFAVNFTSVVDVEGSPTLAVDVGGTEREAAFESVRGSEVLFGYTITDDDFDSDGASVGADTLTLGAGDAIADSGSRAASLTHSAVAGGAGHRVNMSVVTIVSDSGDEPVPENETAGFTLSRTGNLSRALTVSLRSARRQYFVYTARVPSTVDFEPGRATVQFEVPLVNDSDVETEDGSLTVIVAEDEGYLVGSPGSAVAVLTDDGDILLGIAGFNGGSAVEGLRSSLGFGVTLHSLGPERDRPPDRIGFSIATASIDTTSTRDPSRSPGDIGVLATEVVVDPEDWQIRGTQDPHGRIYRQYFIRLPFSVTIFDDLEPEIPEQFRVIVDRSAFTAQRTFSGTFPVVSLFTIVDNEGSFDVRVDQPRVVDIVEGDVLELGLTAVSQFRFSSGSSTSLEVDLEFVDDTASHGTDFVQLDRSTSTTETVEITGFGTVGVGDMRRSQATSVVRISAVDNNDVDAVRQFRVRVGKTPIAPDDQGFNADECSGDPPPDTPACYGQNHFADFFPSDLEGDAGLSGYSMIVRIHDDDATPVAVTAHESSIDEGANAVFIVTRNPTAADLPDPLTVGFDITETADFIDYSAGFVLPTSVTIAANDTTATITIPTADDNVGDGPGEIVATLRPGTVEPQSRYSYTLADRTASVAVSEDEPVLTIADASVSEDAGTVDLAVTLSGTSASAIGFTWATAPTAGDAAATAGQDYQSAGGTVQIDAGDTSATLTVTITDDALDEPDNETFAVDLSAVTGASVAAPQATVTVDDDDDLPEFSISDAAATEGPGASVDFTVSLDTASGRPTEVEWQAVSDEDDARPATEDIDYQGIGATLTIPAGETEATISVQLLNDSDHEPTETFEVRLANPSNSVIADGTGEARILDDDTPTISIDDLSVAESAGTATATVRLSRPAYDEVTLRYGTVANTATAADYTHQSQVTVTIPAGLTTATVAVPILPDDIHEADESFFVDLSDPAGADLGSDVRAVITIVDDDAPPTLSVGDAQAAVESAGPLVFTVTRTGETSLPVTFSWSTDDGTAEAGSDFTAASGTVTIPATSSSAELQVQLVSDLVAEDDETVTVTLRTPIDAVIIDGSATGVILDDDQTAARTPGVVVDPAAVTVTEGDAAGASYTVALSSQPAADVTVAIIGHTGTDLSLSGTGLGSDDTLTFTTTNWSTAQMVTVSARGDADAVDDAAVTLTHTATSGSHSSAPVAVTVTITETDTAKVLVDPADLTVAENGSGTYTVRLATQPSADVTVTVTGHAGSDLTLSAGRLTFTRDNWGTAQTVTVTADADGDGVNDKVTLTNTASGGGYGASEAAIVDVTIDDDGTAAIVVKPSALTMTEGGSSSYTVKLATQPSAAVTVTVSAPEAELTILSVDPRTLRFTPSDWDQPQTVTLEAGYDADTTKDDVTLTHTGAEGGYDGQSAELPVTVTDAEGRAELLVVPSSISVLEGDPGGQTYSVALGSQPTGDVTVTISGHADSDVTLSGATLTSNALTFTVANWNAAQEVTLTAAEDADTANDDVTLTNTATGGGYGTATDVAVTVLDNDTPGLVVTPTEVRVTEGDEAGASYQLSLANMPPGVVVVTITSNSTDVAVANSALFGTVDWSEPKTITVKASDDPDLADEEVDVDHQVTFGSYAASAVQLQVIVEDDDVPGLAVNPRTLSVIEGASATYDMELTVQPSADVTVTIGGHAGTDLTLSGDTLTADSLTFTADNWNQAQSVTATAGEDADTTDDMVTLTHTASGGGYDSLEPVGVAVSLIDDDGPRIDVPAALMVTEGDAAGATYGVKLAVQPSAEVTVTISGHDGSDVTLSGNALTGDELTFTTSSWASAQIVTVTAEDDDDAVNESVVLTHTATGGDYAGLTAQVEVTVVDDDEPEIIVSHSEVTIHEADPDGAVYKVWLATEPSQQVEVEVRGVVGTDLIPTPEVLTFDSSTWKTAKEVKVTAPPDVDTMHEEELIVHLGRGGEYEGTTKTVTVIVQDDDIAAVSVSFELGAYTVAEGGAVAVKVQLSADPEREVVVPITRTGQGGASPADYSGVPASVTFDSGDTEKEITFTATQDTAVDAGESVKLGFGTLPAGVTAGTTGEATVSITDDDVVAVTVSYELGAYTVAEGGAVAVKVQLSADPEREVVVPITRTGQGGASPADYSGVPASVTFDSGDTEKEITFTATQDTAVDAGESVKLGFGTLPAGVTAGTTGEATVSITDDDVVAVTVSYELGAYTVAEGGAVAVKVQLSADPEREVVVPITRTGQGGASPADYSGVPASVTFDSGDTEKEITFTATQDTAVDAGESVKLGFGTLPAGVTAGTTGEATVSITDDDVVAVTVSYELGAYTVAEGGAVAVKVQLSADPEREVVVPITRTGQGGASPADYSGVPASVTFDSGDTEKEITFTATQDTAVDAGESVKLGFGTLPAGVTAGTTGEATVSITDDDVVAVTVSYELGAYTVAEGGAVAVKVQLSADPEREVVVPITRTGQGGASPADYSGVPASVTFDSGDTEKEITFTATQDTAVDAGESVKLGFGTLPAGVTAGTTGEATVSITDDDVVAVTVSYELGAYTVAEGGAVAVKVQLSADPEREVVVPITRTGQGGASPADYSGVPASVTFDSGDTEKEITFTATQDTAVDAGESVKLGFGTLPAGVTAGTTGEATVSITDDDVVAVTVSYELGAYTVAEGGAVAVKVQLSADPEREVVVPITRTGQGGASPADYSGVPASVTFDSGDTEKEITFTATQDTAVDAGESVKLGFGTLPAGVTAGTTGEATVSITDDDVVAVTVSYELGAYTVAEGGAVAVKVQLSADPEREVVVPITRTGQGGASPADYSGVPASVTFDSGDTEKEITFTATQDTAVDAGESVKLGFGTLPAGVTAGTTGEATVSITDDDVVAVTVSYELGAYTVAEGGAVAVKVQLSADPEREVVVPITRTGQGGASPADYSGVPASVTFDSGDTEKEITFTATQDTAVDAGESVKLGFGTLPAGVTAGTTGEATVSITDDDVVAVTVSYELGAYTVAEGGAVAVKVQLSADPEREVVVPITRTGQGGASPADYSGVPASVTFDSGDTEKEITFTATQDTAVDAGESVKLGFGTLPAGVTAGTTGEATVSITDDDVVAVTVSYELGAYTVAEGGAVAVKVQLSADPEREVVVPITRTGQGGASPADYSGVPASVTFDSGDTEKEITFTATQDTAVDAGESVKLGFGTLPAGVTAGTTGEATVSITDDDVVAVTVSYELGAYTVAEGGAVAVKVQLSADPEREVVVPITRTGQGGASPADYSGVPASVTFDSGDTEKEITFTATQDTAVDAGESVKLGFGTLPAGVTAGTTGEATVSITDDDVVAVTVSYELGAYTVAEGGAVAVKVQLSADPEREVVVPITRTGQGGASPADYSGVPASVTFDSGDTEKEITFTATQDTAVDAGESVKLGFGTLPAGVTAGTTGEATVSITDDDVVAVTVSYELGAYTVAEGGAVAVKVQLSADPEREVVVPITRTGQGGASPADYSGVPASVTFDSGDTEKEITFTATQDTAVDAGESVKLGFGTLPAGVTAGTTGEATVSITDDDVVAVTVSYELGAYTVAEGGAVAVKVQLSADPEREVVVPITRTGQGGASPADYSGVPASVTFDSGDTEKEITFTATQDTAVDAGESVKLGFGTLPAGVTAGTTGEATVSITDDDVVAVTAGPPAPRQFSKYVATQNSIAVAWFSVRTAAEFALEMRAPGTTSWDRLSGDFDYLPSRTDNRRLISVVTGLDCDTTYEFRVSARGDGGKYDNQFGPESFVGARTEECSQPERITNLLVTIEPACAVLTWTAPTGTRDTGVQVVRSLYVDYPFPGAPGPLDDYEYLSSVTVLESPSSIVTTFQDCSTDYLVPVYAYSYAVYALDAEGQRFGHYPSGIMPYGPSNRPERVANVRLAASTAASRRLEWNPAPDWRLAIKTTVRQLGSTSDVRSWAPNPDPWITGYRVERREYSPKPPPTPWVRGWTLLGDDWEVVRHEDDGDTSTFFIDNTDAGDKLYVYRVWPYNKYGTSRYSPTAFEWAFMEPS